MSAGLPGAGLAGVFFILSALLAVPLEVVKTVRGTSSRAAWMRVLRNAALALAMIAALQLFFMGVSALIRKTSGHTLLPRTLPVAPVLITVAVLVVVLLAAKALELALRWRASRREPTALRIAWPRPVSLLGGLGPGLARLRRRP